MRDTINGGGEVDDRRAGRHAEGAFIAGCVLQYFWA
jgi:hypothetical protein